MEIRYRTKDLGEAGALLAKGFRLVGLDKEADFYWFVIEGSNPGEISNAYWSGDLVVSAKVYYDNLRSLKDRLFSRR